MRTFKTIFPLLIMLTIIFSCGKDNPTEPEKELSISNYVKLLVCDEFHIGYLQGTWKEPCFSFLKETRTADDTLCYSNINYSGLGLMTSCYVTITFHQSGNDYSIQVSNIQRDTLANTTSYTASITAIINGKKISATLNYP